MKPDPVMTITILQYKSSTRNVNDKFQSYNWALSGGR